MKKGQVSIEYLSITVFLLLVIGLIFGYSLASSNQQIQLNKAIYSVQSLKQTIDTVYSQGPGARLQARVDLPANIQDTILEEHVFGYKVGDASAPTSIFDKTEAALVGALPEKEGTQFIWVEFIESGAVRVGGGLVLSPSRVVETIAPGSTEDVDLNLLNNTSKTITGITAALTGNVTPYVSIDGAPDSTLAPNASTEITLEFNLPANEPAGFFQGLLEISSSEGYRDIALLQLRIPAVLQDLNVDLFADSNYSTPQTAFFQGNTVYYLISTSDQSNQPVEVNDLNIEFYSLTPLTLEYSLTSQSTPVGQYLGSYLLDCSADVDDWNIVADSNVFQYVSDSNTFSVSLASVSTQADNFEFINANACRDQKFLYLWIFRNNGCTTLTIKNVKVELTQNGVLSGPAVTQVQFIGGTAEGGAAADNNTWVEISPPNGFNVAVGTSYENDNWFKFQTPIDTQDYNVMVDFNFSDSSVYSSGRFQPEGCP